MKTIVSVTPIAVTSDSRTYKMAASLTRFGFDSIVVEGLKSNSRSVSLPFTLMEVNGNIIFSKAGGASESSEKRKRSSRQWLKYWLTRLSKPFMNQMRTYRSLPRASLYYLHSFYQFPAVFVKSRVVSAAYIYDAHDFYLAESPGKVNRWLESLCIKYAAAVVTVSSGIAELLQEEYGCKPTVIRNCHDPRLDEDSVADLRQSLGLSVEEFLLVVVGQAKDGMAIREAIESMSTLPPNVHLAFVGKNTQDYSDYVEEARLTSRVHLVPPVTPGQVVPFVRSADAALIIYYPRTENYKNCLPNGFFQSISAQLPLVYAKLPELHRIAEKYRIGIPVDTRSPKELRQGILRLVQDQGLRQTYMQNLELARQELSWEREEKILYDSVEQTLAHIN